MKTEYDIGQSVWVLFNDHPAKPEWEVIAGKVCAIVANDEFVISYSIRATETSAAVEVKESDVFENGEEPRNIAAKRNAWISQVIAILDEYNTGDSVARDIEELHAIKCAHEVVISKQAQRFAELSARFDELSKNDPRVEQIKALHAKIADQAKQIELLRRDVDELAKESELSQAAIVDHRLKFEDQVKRNLQVDAELLERVEAQSALASAIDNRCSPLEKQIRSLTETVEVSPDAFKHVRAAIEALDEVNRSRREEVLIEVKHFGERLEALENGMSRTLTNTLRETANEISELRDQIAAIGAMKTKIFGADTDPGFNIP